MSCGGDGDGDGSEGFSPTQTAADTSRFSGEPPFVAESRKAEARASVSADTERARAEAERRLAQVKGRGNATGDVSLTG
ncbi:hypothetical protein RKD29_007236 [Streptomyces tendae]|uniref:hypothetical protein n=1 Tax=Streptomyces tendae TaxID=1932 RepID=UPI0038391110